jgi:hypothetical protein
MKPMEKITLFLQANPFIGMISTMLSFSMPFIENTKPIIQWVSMVVLLLIGIITLILKVRELLRK